MAVDMFLKLDGIKGESKDHKHKDEIHIESFSWGMNQTGATAPAAAAGPARSASTTSRVTKFVDKSSPALMLHCCNGKHIPNGLITVRKAGDKPLEYLKIKLTDILDLRRAARRSRRRPARPRTSRSTSPSSRSNTRNRRRTAPASPGGEMGWDVKANVKL